jgi:predicted ribosome quality control (RQC) complex YloA/Tae2 family protein
MRKVMLLLAVFGLVSLAWAADPSEGTWKLNIAKSKFAPSTGAAVKEGTHVVRELDLKPA